MVFFKRVSPRQYNWGRIIQYTWIQSPSEINDVLENIDIDLDIKSWEIISKDKSAIQLSSYFNGSMFGDTHIEVFSLSKNLMILQMKKIEIGLDLTKETKKVDLIVQGETNPDMDKIESAKNVGLVPKNYIANHSISNKTNNSQTQDQIRRDEEIKRTLETDLEDLDLYLNIQKTDIHMTSSLWVK